jgi:hypothetical protein
VAGSVPRGASTSPGVGGYQVDVIVPPEGTCKLRASDAARVAPVLQGTCGRDMLVRPEPEESV